MAQNKRKPAASKGASSSRSKPSEAAEATAERVEATALDWTGRVRFIVRRSGRAGKETVLDNLITDAGRALVAQALRDGSALPEITWVAVGSSATAPANGDITLGTETFRKQVTSQVEGGSPNQTVTTVYLAPADANGQIEEVGWFAGSASATADSGVLVARVLYSKLKDNLESIQIERTDTIN